MAPRIYVTEAAIDAMSLAALEGVRDDTLYVCTGGVWAPRTHTALRRYREPSEVRLAAVPDANLQGEIFTDRIRRMAQASAVFPRRLKHCQDRGP